ncbi:MAG: tRNA (adenosine(37)-N6)-threonylcarbamoyltransferase complex dimerization subunit type 1 TsaB [Burkholderiales bacterium]|nr:tRNA (adenosine(37)-N6)-threonylcarbamoyltransferase complex dimerization subunit type 1 TsaB [Burkholderiales bacterium]
MKLLAFDTSTHWLSVACGSGATWAERAEAAGQAHSQRLLPLIDEVLAECGWRLADLDAIAFGAGPGSFTGVRIACSVAQGLALGADLPLLPVCTLEVLAQAAWRDQHEAHIFACLDARMREVYVAAYCRDGESWTTAAAPAVLPPDAVRLPDDGDPWFGAGDGFAVYPQLASRLRLRVHDARIVPDARCVAELALPRVAAGEAVDAAQALPIYVRHRIALTAAERASGARL